MESRAKVLGHSVHQMMIPFPLGALAFSVAMDVCHSVTGKRQHASTARRALDFGLISALAAAPFGVVDYLAITPGTRAKRVGTQHAAANLVMLGMFATSRLLRAQNEKSALARWVSGSAFLVSGVAAWFGGELVNRHAIGVSDGAHQDAPSSLTGPSTESNAASTLTQYPPSPREVTRDWGAPDGL